MCIFVPNKNMKTDMEFNKETFEKALKSNDIVRYQKHF